jgi:hypothetical protein
MSASAVPQNPSRTILWWSHPQPNTPFVSSPRQEEEGEELEIAIFHAGRSQILPIYFLYGAREYVHAKV